MVDDRKLPESLRTALLPLESVQGFEFLETWRWNEKAQRWTVKCRLTARNDAGEPFSDPTDWYVLVSEAYPFGEIDFMPAKQNGLTDTYQHQSYNHEGDPDLPWRRGKLCLNTAVRVLGRHGYDIEPYEPDERLRWHCLRAIDWLRAAYTDSLVLPGEPFEVPHIPCANSDTIVYREDRESFDRWSREEDIAGDVAAHEVKDSSGIFAIEAFHRLDQGVLLPSRWGARLRQCRGEFWNGLWIRLQAVPVLKHWQLPKTWGELRSALKAHGMDLDGLLKTSLKKFRDGKGHFLILGYPIPDRVGEAPCLTHWFAVRLPVLSQGDEHPPGFRANEQGYWMQDKRTILADKEFLSYVETENWDQEQISTRGRMDNELTSKKIAVVGCGALGAPVAEMLVRGGANHLLLFDSDAVGVGNLARHTLSIQDVGRVKATQLAERLNALSPHAEVEGVPAKIASGEDKRTKGLLDCRVIIDCTGSDELLQVLQQVQFSEPALFVSCSIGFRAKRLFVSAAQANQFPVDEVRDQIAPWLEKEQEEFKGEEFPRQGIGCYHPVFPARCDDMWLWASVAVKLIEQACLNPPAEPVLYVYEQSRDQMGLPQIRRVEEAA